MVEYWNELMEIPEAKWIVFGTLLLFGIIIGVYVVSYFRKLAFEYDSAGSDDLLTGFRQMRDEGQLEDDEYSRLKTLVPRQENWSTGQTLPKPSGAETQPVDPAVPEKKYLTLAEAQELKQRKQPNEGESQTTNHEDEANDVE